MLRFHRFVLLIAISCVAFASAVAQVTKPLETKYIHRSKILLIPLDSRPAAGQFAQMIGAMSGVEVKMPPYESLGRFTNAGNVDRILQWLETQDLSDVSSIVVSADMVAYGGLINSRVTQVDAATAISRLRRLITFRQNAPKHIKMYVFATTMRLAPTATKGAASYRMNLAKYEEMKDRYERTNDPTLPAKIAKVKKLVPAAEIIRYERTRFRNHEVQRALIRMSIGPEIDFLIMGQDDAKPDGPHIQENAKLRTLCKAYSLQKKIYFCEGIDQHANILISRAILKDRDWTPRVRVVYSDDEGREQYAMYESKTIEASLADQLNASGAHLVAEGEEFDYTLYLNTPKRREESFKEFLESLKSEVDQGFPVAVADINFAPNGTSDSALFEALAEDGRAMKLLAFAGWNTAGNTMGTSIPAANVYLCARQFDVNPLAREVAKREFVLHRFVDDFAYHKYVRPEAYKLIDSLQPQRDEVYGANFDRVDSQVKRQLSKYLDNIFAEQFLGQTFYVDTKEYKMTSMRDVRIFLPWPRAYEVRVEFRLEAQEVKPLSDKK